MKKTGNRPDGEDLAQEVFMQVFISVSKQKRIDKIENFIWKTAYFTWCSYARTLVRRNACELSENLPDSVDFVQNYADDEVLKIELSRMRHKIADLSKLQREAVILHYLDNLPVKDVAERLGITETAAAWHLFDARKKVKKELETMKNENSYVYSPGKMSVSPRKGMNVSASGDVPQNPDTDKINESLIRQNLCLLCSKEGKTIDELVQLTGVSKPYLEYDLDWLVERELLLLDGKRYQTSFIIMNREYFENRKVVYSKHRYDFINRVTEYLWTNESKIREIGFYGSDFPSKRLMWAIITMFISYTSRNSEILLRLKSDENSGTHSDGGKYHIMAMDCSDGHKYDISGSYNNNGWEDFYGIACDNNSDIGFERYYWLGVYNFVGNESRPEIVTGEKDTQTRLYKLYCALLNEGFSPCVLNADEKEKLAVAVESGIVIKNGNSYKPNFVVFNTEQLARLQAEVYEPLLLLITSKIDEMTRQFDKIHKTDFPKAKQSNIDHHTYLDFWMFGIFTLMFAAEDKKIYLPESPSDGVPLTLVLVK